MVRGIPFPSSIERAHEANPCYKCNHCQRVSKRRWARHAAEWNKAHTSKFRRANYLYKLAAGLEDPKTFEGYKALSAEEAMEKIQTNKDATKIQAAVRMWIRHIENKRQHQEQMEWRRVMLEEQGLRVDLGRHAFLARPRVVNTRVLFGYYELVDIELGMP